MVLYYPWSQTTATFRNLAVLTGKDHPRIERRQEDLGTLTWVSGYSVSPNLW